MKKNYSKIFSEIQIDAVVLKRKTPNLKLEEIFLFLILKRLAEIEDDLSKLNEKSAFSEIPFYYIQCESSPFFKGVFRLGQQLNIPSELVMKSSEHLLRSYEPFKIRFEIPAIKRELHWILKKQVSKKTIYELVQILNFNFSAFHEILHCLLFVAIGSKEKLNRKKYYLFIEALAFIHEKNIAFDYGIPLAKTLKSIKGIHRSFASEHSLWEHLSLKTSFEGSLMTTLGGLSGKDLKQLKKDLMPTGIFIPSRSLVLSTPFVHDVTPKWISEHQKDFNFLQKSFRKNNILPTLDLNDFSYKELKDNPKHLERVWAWYLKFSSAIYAA